MSVDVTDEVSRFIGYLHLDQLLNLEALHYFGSPTYLPRGFAGEPAARGSAFAELFRPTGSTPARLIADNSSPDTDAAVAARLALAPTVQFQPLAPITPAPLQRQAPADVPLPDIRFAFDPIDPTVSYTLGSEAGQLFLAQQENVLGDDDIVDDGHVFDRGKGDLPSHSTDAVEDLIELAFAAVPEGLGSDFEVSSGITLHTYSDTGTPQLQVSLDGNGGIEPYRVESDGTYLNGRLTSVTGQSQADQAAGLRATAESILGEGEIGEARATSMAPEALPVPAEGASFGPTGGAAQIVSAGANEAANVAAVYDFGDAFGSRIVLGDYHEKNVIVQVNAFASAPPSEAVLIEGLLSANSDLRNEASFRSDPGALYARGAVGYAGAENWHVDYIYGDWIDVTSIIQRNVLGDGDIARTTQFQSHAVATLGENDQLNVLNLIELGKSYDLIIVAGDYFKYNAIFQFNVVLDEDALLQTGSNGSWSSGGNVLSNDAAIVGTGGNTHAPLTANGAAIAGAIADQATILDGAWTIGLPGDGDDTFEVLYVTGDYYVYNLILQTNLIADSDRVAQLAGGQAGIEQSASSGANSAANAAIIFDLDTQSAYQMLGGDAYEDTFLVQANIIVAADDDKDELAASDSGLIAVLAAMVDDDASAPADETTDSINPTGHADVLGAMLH